MPETSGLSEKVGSFFNRLKRPQNRPGSMQAEIDKVSREIKGRVIEDNGSVVIDDVIINDRVVALNGNPEDTARARQQKWISGITNAYLQNHPDTGNLVAQEAVKRNRLTQGEADEIIAQLIIEENQRRLRKLGGNEAKLAEIKRKLRTNPDAFSEFNLTSDEARELGLVGLQNVRGGRRSYDASGYGKNVGGAQAAHRENMADNDRIFAAAEKKLADERKNAETAIIDAEKDQEIARAQKELEEARRELTQRKEAREAAQRDEKEKRKSYRETKQKLNEVRTYLDLAGVSRDLYKHRDGVKGKLDEAREKRVRITIAENHLNAINAEIDNLEQGRNADGSLVIENDAYLYDENGELPGQARINEKKEEHVRQENEARQKQIEERKKQREDAQAEVRKLNKEAEEAQSAAFALDPENKAQMQFELAAEELQAFDLSGMTQLEDNINELQEEIAVVELVDVESPISQEVLARFDAKTQDEIHKANKQYAELTQRRKSNAVSSRSESVAYEPLSGHRMGEVLANQSLNEAALATESEITTEELRVAQHLRNIMASQIVEKRKAIGVDRTNLARKQKQYKNVFDAFQEKSAALTKVHAELDARLQDVRTWANREAAAETENINAGKEYADAEQVVTKAREEEEQAKKRVKAAEKRLNEIKKKSPSEELSQNFSSADTILPQRTQRIERQEANKPQGRLRGLLGRLGRGR